MAKGTKHLKQQNHKKVFILSVNAEAQPQNKLWWLLTFFNIHAIEKFKGKRTTEKDLLDKEIELISSKATNFFEETSYEVQLDLA